MRNKGLLMILLLVSIVVSVVYINLYFYNITQDDVRERIKVITLKNYDAIINRTDLLLLQSKANHQELDKILSLLNHSTASSSQQLGGNSRLIQTVQLFQPQFATISNHNISSSNNNSSGNSNSSNSNSSTNQTK